MTTTSLIQIFWVVFIAYWIVSAFGSKKNARQHPAWKGIIFRLLAAVILTIIFNSHILGRYANISYGSTLSYIGAILCFMGLGFAVWARLYLGKDWGMPRTLKENPELVTSGPYRYVRHPIYSGMMLATLGSALALGNLWLAIFVLFCITFIYSAKVEEKNMTEQFPDQYPQYKQRTKMLIPFIF